MSRNEEIGRADWLTCRFKVRTDLSVLGVGRHLERRGRSMVDSTASTLRISRADCFLAAPYRSSAAVMMLAQIPASPCCRSLRGASTRITNQIGHDVCIEQVR